MAETIDPPNEIPPKFDPLIQSEDLGFQPAELIACGGCGRMNPPNRLKCIYCGGELEIKVEQGVAIKPNLRKLELWESGFNVIFTGTTGTAPDNAKIANLLSLAPDDLAAMLDAGTPLPLARVESEKEAAILQNGLAVLGLKSSILSDADLDPDKPPVRLGRIDILSGGIAVKAFNTGKLIQIDAGDLALIIPGLIAKSRVDSLEKKQRRGKTKLIDETATISDETILDIYSRQYAVGFRVHTAGFDFSGLGEDKGLLAAENLRQLIVRLREHAPNARLVNNYMALRAVLGHVWEVETRNEARGLQRSGFGKRDFASIATTNNLNQFTKYSRLQWQLL